MPALDQPRVAIFCPTFLKPEMLHVYRQVAGLQNVVACGADVQTRERRPIPICADPVGAPLSSPLVAQDLEWANQESPAAGVPG